MFISQVIVCLLPHGHRKTLIRGVCRWHNSSLRTSIIISININVNTLTPTPLTISPLIVLFPGYLSSDRCTTTHYDRRACAHEDAQKSNANLHQHTPIPIPVPIKPDMVDACVHAWRRWIQ